MALIAMAIYSTAENKKDECLRRTLWSLYQSVDFTKHRLILSVNKYTTETIKIFKEEYGGIISEIIYNEDNLGTAEAINQAWKRRLPGENAIKMDDDIVINTKNDWIDLMEQAIQRTPTIGQIGLKRRDCSETPFNRHTFYHSELLQLPHEPGEQWINVEVVNHVMGSCVMHSAALLEKVGYLWQPGVYGFDDSFMSQRSRLAGFKNVFLLGIDIEHIDDGSTPFQQWKEIKASEKWAAYIENTQAFHNGKKSIYYNPFL